MIKTAIVTGASSGIGACSARMLADHGFKLCLTARRAPLLDEVCESINRKHGADTAFFHPGDVTDAAVRQETLDRAMSRWGRLDLLVNNAGAAWSGVVEEIELDALRAQFELTTIAYVAWMQLAGPIMRKQKDGRMVNVSSITGRVPLPGIAPYSASKSAIETICDVARLEYRRWGIKVILVAPGAVTTEIWALGRRILEEQHAGWQQSDFADVYQALIDYVENVMQGGAGVVEVETVAKVICHAATSRRPKAKYFTPFPVWFFSHLPSTPAGIRDWVVRQIVRV